MITTIRDYLGQAFKMDQRINAKLEQVSALRELATKITPKLSDTPGSQCKDIHSMENIIVKMIDLENEINADIDKLVDFKSILVKNIKCIDKLEYQILLELRYLCFKKWDQIAVEMDYDLRYLHKLHKNALKYCEKIFEDEIKRPCMTL